MTYLQKDKQYWSIWKFMTGKYLKRNMIWQLQNCISDSTKVYLQLLKKAIMIKWEKEQLDLSNKIVINHIHTSISNLYKLTYKKINRFSWTKERHEVCSYIIPIIISIVKHWMAICILATESVNRKVNKDWILSLFFNAILNFISWLFLFCLNLGLLNKYTFILFYLFIY